MKPKIEGNSNNENIPNDESFFTKQTRSFPEINSFIYTIGVPPNDKYNIFVEQLNRLQKNVNAQELESIKQQVENLYTKGSFSLDNFSATQKEIFSVLVGISAIFEAKSKSLTVFKEIDRKFWETGPLPERRAAWKAKIESIIASLNVSSEVVDSETVQDMTIAGTIPDAPTTPLALSENPGGLVAAGSVSYEEGGADQESGDDAATGKQESKNMVSYNEAFAVEIARIKSAYEEAQKAAGIKDAAMVKSHIYSALAALEYLKNVSAQWLEDRKGNEEHKSVMEYIAATEGFLKSLEQKFSGIQVSTNRSEQGLVLAEHSTVAAESVADPEAEPAAQVTDDETESPMADPVSANNIETYEKTIENAKTVQDLMDAMDVYFADKLSKNYIEALKKRWKDLADELLKSGLTEEQVVEFLKNGGSFDRNGETITEAGILAEIKNSIQETKEENGGAATDETIAEGEPIDESFKFKRREYRARKMEVDGLLGSAIEHMRTLRNNAEMGPEEARAAAAQELAGYRREDIFSITDKAERLSVEIQNTQGYLAALNIAARKNDFNAVIGAITENNPGAYGANVRKNITAEYKKLTDAGTEPADALQMILNGSENGSIGLIASAKNKLARFERQHRNATVEIAANGQSIADLEQNRAEALQQYVAETGSRAADQGWFRRRVWNTVLEKFGGRSAAGAVKAKGNPFGENEVSKEMKAAYEKASDDLMAVQRTAVKQFLADKYPNKTAAERLQIENRYLGMQTKARRAMEADNLQNEVIKRISDERKSQQKEWIQKLPGIRNIVNRWNSLPVGIKRPLEMAGLYAGVQGARAAAGLGRAFSLGRAIVGAGTGLVVREAVGIYDYASGNRQDLAALTQEKFQNNSILISMYQGMKSWDTNRRFRKNEKSIAGLESTLQDLALEKGFQYSAGTSALGKSVMMAKLIQEGHFQGKELKQMEKLQEKYLRLAELSEKRAITLGQSTTFEQQKALDDRIAAVQRAMKKVESNSKQGAALQKHLGKLQNMKNSIGLSKIAKLQQELETSRDPNRIKEVRKEMEKIGNRARAVLAASKIASLGAPIGMSYTSFGQNMAHNIDDYFGIGGNEIPVVPDTDGGINDGEFIPNPNTPEIPSSPESGSLFNPGYSQEELSRFTFVDTNRGQGSISLMQELAKQGGNVPDAFRNANMVDLAKQIGFYDPHHNGIGNLNIESASWPPGTLMGFDDKQNLFLQLPNGGERVMVANFSDGKMNLLHGYQEIYQARARDPFSLINTDGNRTRTVIHTPNDPDNTNTIGRERDLGEIDNRPAPLNPLPSKNVQIIQQNPAYVPGPNQQTVYYQPTQNVGNMGYVPPIVQRYPNVNMYQQWLPQQYMMGPQMGVPQQQAGWLKFGVNFGMSHTETNIHGVGNGQGWQTGGGGGQGFSPVTDGMVFAPDNLQQIPDLGYESSSTTTNFGFGIGGVIPLGPR